MAKHADAPSKADNRDDTQTSCRDEDDRKGRQIGSKMSDEGNASIGATMRARDDPRVLTRSGVGLGRLVTISFMATMSVRATPTGSVGSAARLA
jgi:hypothetical protein